MLRAVLDANVLISALLRPEGPPGQIVTRLLKEDAFRLVVSPATIAEFRRCIGYRRVRKYLTISDNELETRIVQLEFVAERVQGNFRINAVPEDPDDDKYIVAAVEGLAQFIVTGDTHLLRLKGYEGIRIVTPRVFLDLLKG